MLTVVGDASNPCLSNLDLLDGDAFEDTATILQELSFQGVNQGLGPTLDVA
jgi:hypothetical protein